MSRRARSLVSAASCNVGCEGEDAPAQKAAPDSSVAAPGEAGPGGGGVGGRPADAAFDAPDQGQPDASADADVHAQMDAQTPSDAGDGGSVVIERADYYVAPDGDDGDPGTFEEPFATIQKCVDVMTPGQLCYLRGGVYEIQGARRDGIHVAASRSGDDKDHRTRLFAYPGERPVIDCVGLTHSDSVYCVWHEADYWHYRGIEIRGVKIAVVGRFATGMSGTGKGNVFEAIDTHHHEGMGFRLFAVASDNLLVNVDSHHNYDPPGGGNADGIVVSYLSPGSGGNVVRNCRAWWNSDDGFDLWDSEAPVVLENNWSFWNGFKPETNTASGNGDGFKLGRNAMGPKHIVRFNLSFENRKRGFDDNSAKGPLELRNNTSWNDGTVSFNAFTAVAHVLRNNLAFGPDPSLPPEVDDQFNSWNLSPPIGVDAADFLSTDSTGSNGTRAANGSRPVLDFLRLAQASDLRDQGDDDKGLGAYPE